MDLSRDALFDELGVKRLRESYMKPTETSPQERLYFISQTFGSNPEHAKRLYDYSSKHWLSYSTPILSFGKDEKLRGLPISCFLNYIEDTAEGLVNNLSETNWLSMYGGGVGIGFGIRSVDDKSTGVLPHLKTYDVASLAYKQGNTRRGSYAAYLDISHPDIVAFLEMRKPTGDPNLRCLNLHHGVNITDDFMKIIERCMIDSDADDSWNLVDTKSKVVREVVHAKHLWQMIIELRMHTGEPYLHFIDTSNKHLPKWLSDKGLSIKQSNLCSEIILPTNEKRTAVCCLSSLNLELYDEWKKDPLFLRDTAEMLDNVLTYFIDNAPDVIQRAKYSAMRERSIGIGALGFHSYLQKNGIPFESLQAKQVNKKIFKNIREQLDVINTSLAQERGEAPDAEGYQKRFSHVMAIAPNASSSIIMGNISPSIEPYRANAYRQDTLSGSHLNRNKWLEKIITADEVWSSIIAHDGSVQHLPDDVISEKQKRVFKTAMEIDQRWIIELAADRQEFIDQGQSVNVFFRPDAHISYIHGVHFLAWKKGLKTLYYLRSEKIGRADKISKKILIKNLVKLATEEDTCIMCEG